MVNTTLLLIFLATTMLTLKVTASVFSSIHGQKTLEDLAVVANLEVGMEHDASSSASVSEKNQTLPGHPVKRRHRIPKSMTDKTQPQSHPQLEALRNFEIREVIRQKRVLNTREEIKVRKIEKNVNR